MAFTRPVVGTDILAADFGQPVYDWITGFVTPWAALPLGPTMSADGGGMSVPRYRKMGDMVFLIGSAITSVRNGIAVLGTLPSGYRPTVNFRASGVSMDATGTPFAYRMDMGMDGTIAAYIGNWNTVIVNLVIPTT